MNKCDSGLSGRKCLKSWMESQCASLVQGQKGTANIQNRTAISRPSPPTRGGEPLAGIEGSIRARGETSALKACRCFLGPPTAESLR